MGTYLICIWGDLFADLHLDEKLGGRKLSFHGGFLQESSIWIFSLLEFHQWIWDGMGWLGMLSFQLPLSAEMKQ